MEGIGGVDTGESEHSEVCPLSVYRFPRYRNDAQGMKSAMASQLPGTAGDSITDYKVYWHCLRFDNGLQGLWE